MNRDSVRRIKAFEQWCYRRLLKIKWMDKILQEKVLRQIKEYKIYVYKSI